MTVINFSVQQHYQNLLIFKEFAEFSNSVYNEFYCTILPKKVEKADQIKIFLLKLHNTEIGCN